MEKLDFVMFSATAVLINDRTFMRTKLITFRPLFVTDAMKSYQHKSHQNSLHPMEDNMRLGGACMGGNTARKMCEKLQWWIKDLQIGGG